MPDPETGADTQRFHFYVDRSETNVAREGALNMMNRNHLFNLTVLTANASILLYPGEINISI
jgi:hypothetical protein